MRVCEVCGEEFKVLARYPIYKCSEKHWNKIYPQRHCSPACYSIFAALMKQGAADRVREFLEKKGGGQP